MSKRKLSSLKLIQSALAEGNVWKGVGGHTFVCGQSKRGMGMVIPARPPGNHVHEAGISQGCSGDPSKPQYPFTFMWG